MEKQQRRVFLKVIATAPLLGCGPDPSAPTGTANNGGATNASGGAIGSAGGPSFSGAGAGSGSLGGAGSASYGGAGSPSFSGSTSSGGTTSTSLGGSSATSGGAPAVAGASTAGAGGGVVIDPNDPAQPIGNVSLYPLGSFKIAGNIYFMGHDAGGLYAMTMACTHAGCACAIAGSQLTCPCHGSRFDQAGNVLQGPANKPLPHFKVTVDSTGNITVDRFTVVSQSTRTAV